MYRLRGKPLACLARLFLRASLDARFPVAFVAAALFVPEVMDRLAELGDSVLAHAIAMYRQRLKDIGVPLSAFNSSI